MLSIDFNNFNSYRDLGLVVENKPSIPAPQKNINFIEVPGRGTLIEESGTYKNIEINITFGFSYKDNFNGKCRLIKQWLNNLQNKKLMLSNDPNVFYKVKYIKMDNILSSMKVLGKFTVSFILEPFVYYISGLETIILKTDKLYSPEFAYKSEPIIKIYGSGDIVLSINSNIIKLKNVQEHITIDSTIQECYKNNINCNKQMQGQFPILIQGENTVYATVSSYNSNIEHVEITPNWRCL